MITLWWDGRRRVDIDEEEFFLIRKMLEEPGAIVISVRDALVKQGYKKGRATELVILAQSHWKPEYEKIGEIYK